MYGIIYKITNQLNGKPYVGQTTRSIEERFKEHVSHNQYLIGRAIRKYGKENFSIEVLEECETFEQLNERERYWITCLDCIAPKGYNLTDGGEGGFHHTPETRARISAANTGEGHPMFGKHHSAEAKAKIAASGKGRIMSEETKAKLAAAQPIKHAVICIETRTVYESVEMAARCHNIHRSRIILACQEHQRTAVGKHWWYLEDFNNATEIIIPPAKATSQPRAVICLETGEVFKSIQEASRWLGMTHSAISRACRIHYAAGGYHWRYLEEYQRSQE